MPVQDYTITLADFSFPPELPNGKSNFRFVVDLRHKNAKGAFATETAVLPGLDTFWECDKSKSGKPNYVRDAEDSSFDMGKIDAWDRLVLRLRAQELYQLQVKVFDVDRPDFWDKLSGALSGIIGTVLEKTKEKADGLPIVGSALGSLSEDLNSTVSKLLAGGDKVLFKGSGVPAEGRFQIGGLGSANKDAPGSYAVAFLMSVEDE